MSAIFVTIIYPHEGRSRHYPFGFDSSSRRHQNSPRLLPPINIINARYVVLAQIAADLNLDELERDLSWICER
jgi:hypothetical protein